MPPVIAPFRLAVDEAAIEELRARLARVRWPDEAPEEPWRTDSVAFMREMVDCWRSDTTGARRSRAQCLPAIRCRIDGIDVHFLRVQGHGPDPKPLLLSHGWPGSVFEFLNSSRA